MEMFSREEAVCFLEGSWGVSNVAERLTRDRKALLHEVVTQVQVSVPFQSVTLMAVPPEQRRRPSVGSIKAECMAGVGGLCYNLNTFAWYLLKALGFSAQLCPATCTSSIIDPDNHLVVLVNDLEKKGDLHLVECGCGFPTFRAVSLDFEEESPVFVDSFLEYKYVRHEGQILRMQGDGDTIKRNDPPKKDLDFFMGKWRRFYFFSLRPSDDLSDFDAKFDRVFTVPRATPFDHSPRALLFPGKRAVVVVNNRLMVEDEEGVLTKTVLQGDDEIAECYRQYFPALKEEVVRAALQEWRRVQQ
ncbi:uncharacterized protein [Littorina saxatilis]